jgi:hypothetical protein
MAPPQIVVVLSGTPTARAYARTTLQGLGYTVPPPLSSPPRKH